jgi:hypothetical protein
MKNYRIIYDYYINTMSIFFDKSNQNSNNQSSIRNSNDINLNEKSNNVDFTFDLVFEYDDCCLQYRY